MFPNKLKEDFGGTSLDFEIFQKAPHYVVFLNEK